MSTMEQWAKMHRRVQPTVEDVAAKGGRCKVVCADGFTMSAIAYVATYCEPRPGFDVPEDYEGPFTALEVGFPSVRPEPWDMWETFCEDPDRDPTDTVYSYVGVEHIYKLIELHGGYA